MLLMTYLIAVCNITGKLILSGNIDQVDLPGKMTEHKETARKKDKVLIKIST